MVASLSLSLSLSLCANQLLTFSKMTILFKLVLHNLLYFL